MLSETFWLFAPKNYEAKFFHYYILHPRRPSLVMLMLQGPDIPSLLQIGLKYCSQHKVVILKIFPIKPQEFFSTLTVVTLPGPWPIETYENPTLFTDYCIFYSFPPLSKFE